MAAVSITVPGMRGRPVLFSAGGTSRPVFLSIVTEERQLSAGSTIDDALAADMAAYPPSSAAWRWTDTAGGGEPLGDVTVAGAGQPVTGYGCGTAPAVHWEAPRDGGMTAGRARRSNTERDGRQDKAGPAPARQWGYGDGGPQHRAGWTSGHGRTAETDNTAQPSRPTARTSRTRDRQASPTARLRRAGAAGGGGPGDTTDEDDWPRRRGRRRRRDDSEDLSDSDGDGAWRRRRQRRKSSPSSSSDDEEPRDARADHRRVPTRTRAKPAPAALRLPPLRAQAARRLRRRKRFVAAEDVADPAGPAANTTAAFLGQVAAILVHQVYFFPGLGLQALIYLAWLLDRTGGRSVEVARRTDARARQAMALSPRELLTAPELDHFLPAPVAGGGSGPARVGATVSRQLCWRALRGDCRLPCPEGRWHGGTAPPPAVGAPRGVPRPPGPGFARRQRQW